MIHEEEKGETGMGVFRGVILPKMVFDVGLDGFCYVFEIIVGGMVVLLKI